MNLRWKIKRNIQREELFILTIVERVLAGHLQLISFVDQAQFSELLTKRQTQQKAIPPLHLQILGKVKRNLIKNQTPLLEKKVQYEIRTVASSSIDMRKNYIHSFSNRQSNNKEQQTTEIDAQMIGHLQPQSNRNSNLKLDKTDNSCLPKYHTNRSQKMNNSSARYISPFQLISPNSTQAENINKELPSLKQSTINENLPILKNEMAVINIVSQDGEIEQQQDFIIKNNNINIEPIVNQNQQQLQRIEKQDSNAQYSYSRKQSQNLPMGSDSSKMDLKEKLQKYYSNDEDFSSQRKPRTQSDRLKDISYGTDPNAKDLKIDNQLQIIQSAKNLDNNNKSQVISQQSQQAKFSFIPGQTQELVSQSETFSKDQLSPKKSLEEIHAPGNFLSPPQSARSIITAKSTKRKLNTLQSNDLKLFDQQNPQEQQQVEISASNEESQMSLLEQSLHQNEQNHHTHISSLRPATTHIEASKQQDYPVFQTHDNLDIMKKSTQKLLQQQTSITSIMHDEENFQNNQTLIQHINIQVNQCDPTQPPNNVIIEESIEGSPNCKVQNTRNPAASFSLLKLEDQKQMPTQTNLQFRQQSSSPKNGYIPSSSFIPSSTLVQGSQSQSKMLIPINNTQNSIKHNRVNNKSRSQIKDFIQQQQQQQRSDDSQPESKLTIESSQGDKSNRSKKGKNKKQLKLPIAAVALNFARRKSSNQISPMDPKKLEQQEKEKQRQLEYQKQLEKMKYERELMEQFKIPDNMPLMQKRSIIEQLMKELELNPDQDAKYQIMLYKQRQEQIQNASKFELAFDNPLSNCYEELSHISEQKLKILGKDNDPTKVQFLKFEDQVQTNFHRQSKSFTQDLNSPNKKNLKFFSKLDPVEIENQMNRIKEFKQETDILKFFSSFNNQYDKEVNQCDLDQPTVKDRQFSMDFQRGFLPKTIHRRKRTKKKSTKIVINSYRMDPKKLDQVLAQTEKIKQVGQFLL
ncbi:unnamed protein product (macronuclear) [Paramecium tetraurelia]|uniref:Uncharacterized protein n=1 Tax=Paramecium tetraurelia TaxID=5888 RepID=A0E7H8_PARTE|nr:uncharacterized protein GSPATT00023973001 [Paramecium tetraurelia]CAK91245.1 unnamed protein product [Paramecium tetraurelia]|eukprot:XP_001458642.1 hypothetical protein (macronuclear) [Paramecium tetraurelia strain d4-2]